MTLLAPVRYRPDVENIHAHELETIKGLNDTGTATVPKTTAGETTSCNVTLPSAPTPGSYQVTATVEKVPGETNVTNNSMTFPITFT